MANLYDDRITMLHSPTTSPAPPAAPTRLVSERLSVSRDLGRFEGRAGSTGLRTQSVPVAG